MVVMPAPLGAAAVPACRRLSTERFLKIVVADGDAELVSLLLDMDAALLQLTGYSTKPIQSCIKYDILISNLPTHQYEFAMKQCMQQ